MTFVFHFIKVLLYLVDLLLYLVAVENVEQMKYILNAFRRFYERKQVVLCNCVVFHFFCADVVSLQGLRLRLHS
jgi:hypothetical protein